MKKGGKEDPKRNDTGKGAAGKVEAAPEAEEIKEVPQSGHGKFEYINQTIYEGAWKLEKGKKLKHGHGKIIFSGPQGQESGHEEYEGEWINDKMHG